MAFFLIGKGPQDELGVVSPMLFASRHDAMAELSRLSADPGFRFWDSEVVVMDLDAGTPVLLVRPREAAASAVPVAEMPEEPVADAWMADLPADAEAQASAGESIELEEAAPAAVSEAAPTLDESGAAEVYSGARAEAAAPEAVSTPETSAEVGTGAVEPAASESDETTARSLEDVAGAWSALGEHDELREAILRTTQHMSAQGVVPPPSAGLSETEPGADAEPAAEEPADTSTLEAAYAAFTPAEESAAASTSAWPWASTEPEPSASATIAEEAEPEPAEVYSALEEPTAQATESGPDADSSDTGYAALVDPVTNARKPMSSRKGEPEGAPGEESDFILDLEAIAPAGETQTAATAEAGGVPDAAVDAPSAEAEAPAKDADAAPLTPTGLTRTDDSLLTDYTCDDCVYVATCPNRDQRLPKDCGSFQWK